jgi:hypothetical protein
VELACKLVDDFAARGVGCVWICKKRIPGSDRLACATTLVPDRYITIKLEDIKRLLTWCLEDDMVRVGDTIWKQIQGLSQGSPFSPFLARWILDVNHHRLWKQPRSINSTVLRRLPQSGKPIGSKVATKFHVDDSIWWSFVLCCQCITTLVTETWPSSLGLTVESTDQEFVFLHTNLSFQQTPPYGICVGMRNQNLPFIHRNTQHPVVCGLPPHVCGVSKNSDLGMAFAARFWLIAGIYQEQRASEAALQVIYLACEALLLSWPPKKVWQQICKYRNHRFRYINNIVITIGLWLRKNRHHVPNSVVTKDTPAEWAAFTLSWEAEAKIGFYL